MYTDLHPRPHAARNVCVTISEHSHPIFCVLEPELSRLEGAQLQKPRSARSRVEGLAGGPWRGTMGLGALQCPHPPQPLDRRPHSPQLWLRHSVSVAAGAVCKLQR